MDTGQLLAVLEVSAFVSGVACVTFVALALRAFTRRRAPLAVLLATFAALSLSAVSDAVEAAQPVYQHAAILSPLRDATAAIGVGIDTNANLEGHSYPHALRVALDAAQLADDWEQRAAAAGWRQTGDTWQQLLGGEVRRWRWFHVERRATVALTPTEGGATMTVQTVLATSGAQGGDVSPHLVTS